MNMWRGHWTSKQIFWVLSLDSTQLEHWPFVSYRCVTADVTHSLTELISRRRTSLFGHIARLDAAVPVHQALWLQTNISTGRNPGTSRKRLPGRPRKHGPLRFQMILECHRALTGMPSFVVAMKEGRYGLWRLRADDDDDDDDDVTMLSRCGVTVGRA